MARSTRSSDRMDTIRAAICTIGLFLAMLFGSRLAHGNTLLPSNQPNMSPAKSILEISPDENVSNGESADAIRLSPRPILCWK